MKIEIFSSREGTPNAKVTYGDRTVTLHSQFPSKEAEKVISHVHSNSGWVVVAGFGFGYIIEQFLQDASTKVIVYEHLPEIWEAAKNSRSLQAIENSDRFFLFHHPTQIIEFLEQNRIKELSFYIHRPYLTLFPEEYSSLEGILIAHLSRSQINQATLKRFQQVWLRNILKNSAYYFNTPGVNQIKADFSGKPAVIVGAGPSLSKNINQLARLQQRAVIISTDTALNYLAHNGIQPDFVVCSDPQDKNALYLLYSGITDTVLIMDSASSFFSLAKYRPRLTLLYDTIFPLYKEISFFWGEKGQLLSGGSVSTTAFDCARYLKCDPIIMIGQDLAFSRRHTHSPGNILEEFLYYRINRLHTFENYNSRTLIMSDKMYVDGYHGEKVPTDRKFMTFLNWFRREIALTEAEVINSTEGGSFIEGAKHIPFSQAVEQYLTADLDKTVSAPFSPETNKKNYWQYLEEVRQICDQLIPLAVKAKSAGRKAEEKFRRNAPLTSEFEDMNRFDSALLNIIRQGSTISRFMELTMQSSIERILDNTENQRLSEPLIQGWIQLYEEATWGLKKIRHLIRKVLNSSLASAD